uniref:Rho guanine nucleotide exchange factor 5 n=1 Tax=Knipowitschia caucasica TaxID=637954 RepID=A0AAV2MCB9_KNICA
MRKNDKPRAFERESSAERRRDRDVYRDKAQRRDGRRDTRSEGEVDERDKRRRERVKEKDEVHYQHSRSEGEARAKGEKDQDNTDDFEDNTPESDDRSDEWCDMDRERMQSAEDGFITVSSGGEDEEDREDEFKDCMESFGGEQDLNQATSDDSSYEQGRDTPPKYVFCVVGQPDHSPGDDKMAKNWSAAQIKIELEYDEEEEAIRIRMSGAWSMSEEPKRHSQAPHLKWAKNVVREILGQSDEKIDSPEDTKTERKGEEMPIPVIKADDELETKEEESLEGLRDDENERSKSWGELDLRNILDTLGKRKRNSKFFKAAQLYQQYSEAAQNFEILRQARSDVVSVVEVSSSAATSPLPARRPLPPLPQNPHPHSLSHTGSVSSVQSLPLPPPPAHSQRRASSPRLSISLGQSATLWRDLPAVRNSPELQELTEDQRRLQEVRFEVVTSEASYCRSLDIVVEHFVKSKQLGALLTTQDRNWLFSRLGDVRAISHSFLSKLEEKVESDVMAFSVCDVIARHCQRFKMVYVPYLTNQSYQDATYQRLMNENQGFRRIVEKLERSPLCQRLPLRSFLVLPFQRITRIKLLVQNIVKRTTPGTPQAIQAIKSLRLLEKLIQESNDSITQMKSIESLVSLSAKVDFECKTLPLVSQSRILMREGKVTELMDFSLKEQERSLYLHLFNDNLLVSQQKEGGRFTVIDTCPVSELRVENFQIKLHSLQKNVFRLHMSSKALLLRTDTQSDKLRWISALSRPHSEVDFSTAQDFPQMQCIRAFMAQQPDELSLEKADIILVHQQSSDHWVEGTRLSDRHRGWIPESHLDHISIPEIRERNLSDALKLTTATAQNCILPL